MRWYQRFFHREIAEKHLDAELRFHLDQQIAGYVAAGMKPEEARRRATLEFGGLDQVKEECRDVGAARFIETLIQDLRYGLRQLRNSPGFTLIALMILALGIGANTAVGSLLHDVNLARLPINRPEEMVQLLWRQGLAVGTTFNWPDYESLMAPQPALPGLFAYLTQEMNLRSGSGTERVRAHLVSGSYYSTLGVKAFRGRVLQAADDRPSAPPAAVLSYAYWGRRFGFNPNIIARTVYLDGAPFTIVGVAPPEFYGLNRLTPPDITCPLHLTPLPPRKSYYVAYFSRLQAGMSVEQAKGRLGARFLALLDSDLKAERSWMGRTKLEVVSAATGDESVHMQLEDTLAVLGTLVGLILFICCANLATLLLGRAAARGQEIAVRLALGAGRGCLIRQLLTESVLLSVAGSGLGLFVGYGVHTLLRALLSLDAFSGLQFRLHGPLLAFTAGVSLATGVAFGLVPALHATAVNPGSAGKGSAPIVGRLGLGPTRTLLVGQVAVSVLVLVVAALFNRTLRKLETVDVGFNRDHLLLMTIDPRTSRFQGDRIASFLDELTERIRAVPGVRSAAVAEVALFQEGAQQVWVQGAAQSGGAASYNVVGPDFFATAGIPLLLGREFSPRDRAGAPRVAIVNESFARTYFAGRHPLGGHFGDDGPNSVGKYEIIGVVKDTRSHGMRWATFPADFHSFLQSSPDGPFELHVRVMDSTRATAASLREVTRGIDPGLAVYNVRTMTEQINGTLGRERTFAALSALLGALALSLCCVGLYGVASYTVTRRTREVGIRMAVGAARTQIMGLFLRQTLALVFIGAAIGIPIALACTEFVKGMLFGLTPTDPVSVAIALFLLVGVAAMACWLPARRATKVDPVVALRYE